MKKQLFSLFAIACLMFAFASESRANLPTKKPRETENAFIIHSFTMYYDGYEIHLTFNMSTQTIGTNATVYPGNYYPSYYATVVSGAGDTTYGDGSTIMITSPVTVHVNEQDRDFYLYPLGGEFTFDW